MDWFVRFPSSIHGSDNYIFQCSTWVRAKAKDIFAHGKECNKLKKDDLVKDEMYTDQKQLTLVPKQQLAFTTATVIANNHVKSAIIAQLRTVLTQVKHHLPIMKNAAYINA